MVYFLVRDKWRKCDLGVYPERDPENIAILNYLLSVHLGVQKSTMKSSCERGGGARGAYLVQFAAEVDGGGGGGGGITV